MIGRLLCLLGLHRRYSYSRRFDKYVRVWSFCRRAQCHYVHAQKEAR